MGHPFAYSFPLTAEQKLDKLFVYSLIRILHIDRIKPQKSPSQRNLCHPLSPLPFVNSPSCPLSEVSFQQCWFPCQVFIFLICFSSPSPASCVPSIYIYYNQSYPQSQTRLEPPPIAQKSPPTCWGFLQTISKGLPQFPVSLGSWELPGMFVLQRNCMHHVLYPAHALEGEVKEESLQLPPPTSYMQTCC